MWVSWVGQEGLITEYVLIGPTLTKEGVVFGVVAGLGFRFETEETVTRRNNGH